MEQMVTANIMLDIFSIVLSLIPVVYTLNNRRYRQRLNQYFLGVSISNVFMIMGDLSDWTLRDIHTPASDFFIPPLTLQPLMENAVQHGILHKKRAVPSSSERRKRPSAPL